MIELTIPRDLPFPAEAFWAHFLDSDFAVRAFMAIGFTRYDLLEIRDEPASLLRKVDARPMVDAPVVVQKVIGPSFGYVELGRFDRATKLWTWAVTPSVLAERSRIQGTIRAEPLGADRCRVVFQATIEIKLLGLGGVMESTGEKSTRASWSKFMDYCEASIQAAR
jgi:hypothetical protein